MKHYSFVNKLLFGVFFASTCQLLSAGLFHLLQWQQQTALTFPSWDNGAFKWFNPRIISIYVQQHVCRKLTIYCLYLGNWSTVFQSLMRRVIAWENLPVLLSRPLYRWWCPESAWQYQPWVRSLHYFNNFMLMLSGIVHRPGLSSNTRAPANLVLYCYWIIRDGWFFFIYIDSAEW